MVIPKVGIYRYAYPYKIISSDIFFNTSAAKRKLYPSQVQSALQVLEHILAFALFSVLSVYLFRCIVPVLWALLPDFK